MTYNNSHFNYHHLNRSHYVLYSEWNKDEFPNPTRTALGSRLEGPSKDSANPNDLKIDDEYWDNYLEDEDYQLFKNAKLESNGVVTFTIANLSLPLPSQNTALEVHNEESSTLTGSIFVRDGRVIAKAKHRQLTGGL